VRAAIKGRLVLIEHCDFRRSEWTNLQLMLKGSKLTLGKSEVVAMVSGNGKQIIFCYAHDKFSHADFRGQPQDVGVVQSIKYRLTAGGSWSPTMLSEYAAAVGLELIGLKRFEKYYKAIIAERKLAKEAKPSKPSKSSKPSKAAHKGKAKGAALN
jgi:hypothetical protein